MAILSIDFGCKIGHFEIARLVYLQHIELGMSKRATISNSQTCSDMLKGDLR